MANIKKRLPRNAPGDYFVDRTCENCDICRQIAPETFGTESFPRPIVRVQPQTDEEKRRAMWAILSCPNGSIKRNWCGDCTNSVECAISSCHIAMMSARMKSLPR